MTRKSKKKKSKRLGHHIKKRYKKSIKKQLERELLLLSKYDIDSIDHGILPLTDSDTLFVQRKEKGWYNLDSDMFIQDGYASASAILLTLIRLSKDGYLRECYIFPAIFCLRQYLELSMKDSILFFRLRRKVVYAGEANLEGHDLALLWNNLKMYIDKYDSQVENK